MRPSLDDRRNNFGTLQFELTGEYYKSIKKLESTESMHIVFGSTLWLNQGYRNPLLIHPTYTTRENQPRVKSINMQNTHEPGGRLIP